MLQFQASDPFPLLDPRDHKDTELQNHAQCVDAWLGFEIDQIEARLATQGSRSKPEQASHDKQQLWFGLATQRLLTPYIEIRALLARLNLHRGVTIVDLGAGYGRMGFVLARHHPEVGFIGYEFVGERVRESQRVLGLREPFLVNVVKQIRIEHADLSALEFTPARAQIYFIYDYGSLKAIEKTLYDLRRVAARQSVTLVARGRHCRMLVENRHLWLKEAYLNEAEGRSTIYVSDPDLIRAGVANAPAGLPG